VIATASAILFTRHNGERSAEAFAVHEGFRGYIARMSLFSPNAPLYMVHVVGMDVIYGTWEVVFNLYLLTVGFIAANLWVAGTSVLPSS